MPSHVRANQASPRSTAPCDPNSWQSKISDSSSHFWARNPSQLVTNSQIAPGSFSIGNGASIYQSAIIPALESAEQEIIFVTCFWARSKCLDQLSATLLKLSQRASSRPTGTPKLRVRLCFSSRSLVQKLLHTSSADGFLHPPSTWVSKLGLPPPDALSGLDLQIKSLFFLPFSVMHPKFVIIDRKRALIPSCNLSWESWLEGCLPLTGPVVDRLLDFWNETWGRNDLPTLADAASHAESTTEALASSHTITLLPSPHHRSPRFRPFLQPPAPPSTPLNGYVTELIDTAKISINILTPNLTSPPVLKSLLDALSRGVDVTIITNRRMMVVEQLLTAGTITELCVRKLKRNHRNLIGARRIVTASQLEQGQHSNTGTLSVGYFRPGSKYAHSHIKCTIVDEQLVVLGSGNMDRASWYTSQELGVAVEGSDFVKEVWRKVDDELAGQTVHGGRSLAWVEWV